MSTNETNWEESFSILRSVIQFWQSAWDIKRWYDRQSEAAWPDMREERRKHAETVLNLIESIHTSAANQAAGQAQTEQPIADLLNQIKVILAALQRSLADLEQAHDEIQPQQDQRAGDASLTARAEATLSSLTSSSEPPDPDDALAAWRGSRTFHRDSRFIQLLGGSVECRREALLKQLARGQTAHISGTVKKMLRHLTETWGLIEQVKVPGVQRGQLPCLVRLTTKGCQTFQFLAEREPLLGFEMLLARHAIVQQVYLVLEASEVLSMAGYAVDLLPATIPLAEGRRFDPDLLATREHDRIYVEVEDHNSAEWDKKWRRVMSGTNGQIHIVTRTAKTMFRLQAEIEAQRFGQVGVVRLTNLEDVHTFFAEHQTIWISERPLT